MCSSKKVIALLQGDHPCESRDVLRALLDILLPLSSLRGEPSSTCITDEEKTEIMRCMHPIFIRKAVLQKRGIEHVDEIIAASTYDHNPLFRQAILKLKYGRIAKIHEYIGQWMADECQRIMPREQRAPLLCPVPLHWTRAYWRGFNQATLLAQKIAQITGWEMKEMLRRVRPTGHQTRRTQRERRIALLDAITIDTMRVSVPPPWIIVIDDVCTTGATLQSCALALKNAGVKRVTGLVAAYG